MTGLSPVQAAVAAHVLRRIKRPAEAARTVQLGWRDTGRVVFVAGEPHSGRSNLLRWLAAAVPHEAPNARVLHGRFTEGEYKSAQAQSRDQADPTLEAAVTGIVKEVVQPVSGLLAQLVDVLGPARTELLRLLERRQRLELDELVPRLMRCEAKERPLVCLIDDFDSADGSWFEFLLVTFAQEIADELPIFLVLAVEGPPSLPATDGRDDRTVWRVARGLRERDLADWCGLRRLDRTELSSWLGAFEPSVASALWDITAGRSGAVADTWSEWRSRGAIELGDDDRWRPTAGAGRLLSAPADDFAIRLASLLGDEARDKLDDVREALACGALEGRTFTADAVAAALADPHAQAGRWDPDELIDVLDRRLAVDNGHPGAILLEHDPRAIDSASGRRHVSCYTFRSSLDWRIARERLVGKAERERLALALADALRSLYSTTPTVARRIASLLRVANHPDANRYERTARTGLSHDLTLRQATVLMGAVTREWPRPLLRWAASELTKACKELFYVVPGEQRRDIAARANELAHRAAADPERAYALYYVADTCSNLEGPQRVTRLREALELCEHGRGDAYLHVDVLVALALAREEEDVTAARRDYKAALQRCWVLGPGAVNTQSMAHRDLAALELSLRNVPVARSHAQQALRDALEVLTQVSARHVLAHSMLAEGQHTGARDVLEVALMQCRRHELWEYEARVSLTLGKLETKFGGVEQARGHLDRAAELVRRGLGHPWLPTMLHVRRAFLYTRTGNWQQARAELAAVDLTDLPVFVELDLLLDLAALERQLRAGAVVAEHLEHAAALAQRRSDSEAASAILRSVLVAANELGAETAARRVSAELQRLGVAS